MDHIEENDPLTNQDSELQALLMTTQSQIEKCNEINKNLKEKIALLTKDNECYKLQLLGYEKQAKREKGFEIAF